MQQQLTASPMQNLPRQELAATAHTIVVKVGTRVLTDESGALDLERIDHIADQIAQAVAAGRRVVLVSSGSVGAGIGRLGLKQRPTDLAHLQAAAAVGQSELIEVYNQSLEPYGHHAAQVLLTVDDLNQRDRYLNVRNTLMALFEYGAVPILNENDTVRVGELERNVGDNDRLAAVVASLLGAPLLVILSDIEGLYDGKPGDPGVKVMPMVEHVDDSVTDLVSEGHTATAGVSQPSKLDQSIALSTGGMATKLQAVKIATTAGESVIIANGRRPNVLTDILAGEEIGTLFLPTGQTMSSRKRWIGWNAQPQGQLTLDAGAERALEEQGKSLLAVGITSVKGEFGRGDLVTMLSSEGVEIARGLTNYDSEELHRIQGQPSDKIADLLGHRPFTETVHRDNLVLVRAVKGD